MATSTNRILEKTDMVYHTTSDAYKVKDVRMIGGSGDTAGIIVEDCESDH